MLQNKEVLKMSANQINALFDAVEYRLNPTNTEGFRERWIFEQVFGESPETLRRMFVFTKDVTTCPPEVIVFCQQSLAPKQTAFAA